ncbi:MAG: cytochrome b [Candidatus Puniceispirillum sp.]|nr:cytochrome b [Candidatus Puniceispirillum sp.]
MLRRGYNWMLQFAGRPSAPWVLAAVSFAESSFFPLPPDPLFIAMLVANKKSYLRLATLCTATSVVGGFLGYYIGYALYETFGEWIVQTYGMDAAFEKLRGDFNQWGFWIIALKGLTPIPYKIVTIASGVSKLDMLTFVSASCIARGFRFFTLGALLYHFGEDIRTQLDKNLGLITGVMFGALIFGFVIIKYWSVVTAFFSSLF